MPYKYATQINEKSAKAVGLNLPISWKHSVEICRMIRGVSVVKGKNILEKIISMDRAVPMVKFHRETGHKKGMAAGRYPWKAATNILVIVKSAESNASDKGLLSDGLFIKAIVSHKASEPMHYGRKGRRKMKRTHIEVVVEESVTAKEKKAEKKTEQKIAKQPEQHKAAKEEVLTTPPKEPQTESEKPQKAEKPKTQKVNKASTKQKEK